MRKRLAPPPWEWTILGFIVATGLMAPEVPLERYGYAFAGVLICIGAAAVAIETWRREDFSLWHATGSASKRSSGSDPQIKSVDVPNLFFLETAHERSALGAGGEEKREVGPGEDELHAHVDVPLEELGGVHAAHAGKLAVLAARGDDALVGVGDLRVVELARDAH